MAQRGKPAGVQKGAPAKRKLPFDPTPKKGVVPSRASAAADENRKNGGAVRPVAVAGGGQRPLVTAAKSGVRASSGVVEESFALNFSTFLEAERPALDATVSSPVSFDLSDIPSSDEDDASSVAASVAGITATTFLLENRVEVDEAAAAVARRRDLEALSAAKDAAVRQRLESENQLREVEEQVRQLREELERQRSPVAAVEVAPSRGKSTGQQLVRFATSPTLRKAKDAAAAAAAGATDLRGANSTTDLRALRRAEPLNGATKRERLQALRALGAAGGAKQFHANRAIVPEHRPIAAVDARARTKSRPQKVKMLRAVSTLEPNQLPASRLEACMDAVSPATVVGAASSVPPARAAHPFSWPGDEPEDGSQEVAAVASASSESEEAAPAPAAAALFRRTAPAPQPAAADSSDEQSESMESEAADVTVALDQTVAAPVKSAAQLREASVQKLLADGTRSQEQLDAVTDDPRLAGLFGEHLRGTRDDAILRALDDIREYKALAAPGERLSLARSIFQMYLSDSAARENAVSRAVVNDDLRVQIKARVRAEQSPPDLFCVVEVALREHLAREIPRFVAGDLYRTLGFRKSRSKKPMVQAAFAAPGPAPTAAPQPAAVAVPLPTAAADRNDELDEEEESSCEGSPQVRAPAPAVTAAAPVAAVVVVAAPPVVLAASEADTTVDSILEDPKELETFLSFVESTDKKAAQKAGANVAFLLKVNQFNRAPESERPKVARTIYDSYLADGDEDGSARRDQKGQVEVDVSELRKRQIVSRYRGVLERTDAKEGALHKGFFDKAAKDVEAFVEPQLQKYNDAKKQQKSQGVAPTVAAPRAAPPAAQKKEASQGPTVTVTVPSGTRLSDLLDAPAGPVLEGFLAFARDLGRTAPARFLEAVAAFKRIEGPAARTAAASSIMETFVSAKGAQALVVPEHVRSGPEGRWGVFAKRNMIKPDFFDTLSAEVVQQLEVDTWPRFVAASATATVAPVATDASSSVLSESSNFDDLPSGFAFGATLQRGEIEAEMLRRMREEHDVHEASDSGVEDSPDAIQTVRPSVTVPPPRDLDLSPGTAVDLLSRLEEAAPPPSAAPKHAAAAPEPVPMSSADTVVFAKRAAPRAVGSIFDEQPARPARPQQVLIPVQRRETAPAPPRRLVTGVWPSRAGKLQYAESLDGKRHSRYIVLKNKSLYVWLSEVEYRKNKDPSRVLDMDHLLRATLVRESDKNVLLGGAAGVKWSLRVNFEHLNFVVILCSESSEVLMDWKGALLDSAPHLQDAEATI